MYFEIIEIGVPTNKHHQKERMKKFRVSDSMEKTYGSIRYKGKYFIAIYIFY